jgi:hypothetical protein
VFDQITFQRVEGKHPGPKIQFLALSTCGFCRRGQDFLAEVGLGYEYVHLDLLDPEVKAGVKAEFKDKFGTTLSYPALVVDGERQTVGFVRRHWETFLGAGGEGTVSEAEPVE